MHTTMPELETYSRAEAARRLGVAVSTMKRWAVVGRGPRYSRTGDVRGRTIYSAADLAAWLDEHKTTPRAVRGGVTTTKTGG
jgi:hypothetical protein